MREVLYGGAGEVLGIATGDMGIARDGSLKSGFTRGIELHGKYTLIAEGAQGSLAKELIAKFGLDKNREPQKFGIGLKELWRIDPALHRPGLVQHTFGWPLDDRTGGGSFLYHFEDGFVAVGFVVHLNYWNPTLSPFDEFQRFKTHPMIAPLFAGGQRISFGARAITEGGWQSVPKLVFPGGALIGCAAGFVNVPRIKGSHNAMLSGMLAAEHVVAALEAGRAHDEVIAYEEAWRGSALGRDLYKVRNAKPLWSKFGTKAGIALGGLDMWVNEIFGASPLGTLKHGEPDHASLKPLAEVTPIQYEKPDGKLTFDRLASVYVSNTNHEEDQPCHLHPQGSVDSDREKPTGIWRTGAALLSRRRLRSGLCQRGGTARSAFCDQRAELRPLQDVRHQGPGAKHRLGAAGRRRRPELSEYVIPSLADDDLPRGPSLQKASLRNNPGSLVRP